MSESTLHRKQELVQQGAAFRAGLCGAVQDLSAAGASAFPLKGALGGATTALAALLNVGGLSSLRSLLPLAGVLIPYLSKRHLIKPVLRGAAIAGAVALCYRLLARKKDKNPAVD